jgi:hypothetical protein
MKYQGTIEVDKAVADDMEKLCQEPDDKVGKCEAVFDEEYDFGNGMVMAVQVCATTRPREESCWTQGVLFAKGEPVPRDDGGPEGHMLHEITCTDVGESFLGEYCIFDGDDEYTVTVVEKGN